MKELSIEEKAKAYDKALEKARLVLQERGDEPDGASILSELFPELAESEDERIRKALIEYFNEQFDMSDWNGVYGYQVVAWLEKQGKHANFRNKIQIGDKVTRNQDGMLVNLSQLKRVAKKDEKQGNNIGISEATKRKLEDNLNKALEKETPESWNKFLDEQGEQKPLDIEIPFGAKDSELVEETYHIPDGYHAEINSNTVVIKKGEQKPAWSEDKEILFKLYVDLKKLIE